jgi:hypothetical protein
MIRTLINYCIILQLIIILIVAANSASGQSVALDSVVYEEGKYDYIFKGYSESGMRVGTWTGKDLRTDSVKYYLVYQDGYLLKRYYIDQLYGPMLQLEMSSRLDTITEYVYDNKGRLSQVFVRKIVSDSLLNKNCLSFCAKEEGAVVTIKRFSYTYDYFKIIGMNQIYESIYGGEDVHHYYYNGEYVCSFNENGRCIRGDKRRYKKLMNNVN